MGYLGGLGATWLYTQYHFSKRKLLKWFLNDGKEQYFPNQPFKQLLLSFFFCAASTFLIAFCPSLPLHPSVWQIQLILLFPTESYLPLTPVTYGFPVENTCSSLTQYGCGRCFCCSLSYTELHVMTQIQFGPFFCRVPMLVYVTIF